MQQSLSRVVGTHMTLIGLLSSSLMPSAAFAATDTGTAALSVNVNSRMTIAVTAPAAFNGVVPGGAQETADAPFTIATNGFKGYNVTAVGSNTGGAPCTSDVLCHTTLAKPIVDVAADYSGTGAAVGTGAELGLVFRIRSTATGAGDNTTRWGTDAAKLFAAFPTGTARTILNQSTDASGSMGTAYSIPVTYNISVPGSQTEGAYQGTITYAATTNP